MKSVQHDLKCEFEFFEDVESGKKNFELRLNDRNYQEGDTLLMRQLNKDKIGFTGKVIERLVMYVLKDAERFGLEKGYCIMSIV